MKVRAALIPLHHSHLILVTRHISAISIQFATLHLLSPFAIPAAKMVASPDTASPRLSPNNRPKPTSMVSINEPIKPPSSTPRRPPNKRALSSNHIGAPPDLFPRLSAHASHILLFFLLCLLSLAVYLLNPNFLGSIIRSLSASSGTTVGVVIAATAAIAMGLVYGRDVYKMDWYEVVTGHWWILIPSLVSVGWVVVMAQEAENGRLKG